MKKYIILLCLKAALITPILFIACSRSDDGYSNNNNNNNNNNNTNNSVSIGSSSFSPSSISVKSGTTVTWSNNVYELHTVTADDGSFNSGDLDYNKTFSRTFNQAGTFAYHCNHHSGMKGSVVVTP
jgi:plastocyanin